MTEDRFRAWKPPIIPEGKPTKYGWIVQHVDGFKLRHWTDIGAFTYIQAKNGLILEDEVQIGSHCTIYSVPTMDRKEGLVLLKRNCRIGSHRVVMSGVTVGENAIMGAFSFVTMDVPAGALAYGVPAKVKEK